LSGYAGAIHPLFLEIGVDFELALVASNSMEVWYASPVTKQTAIKLTVDVKADHTVRLPDDVPIGPAELIVFVKDQESGALPVDRAPSPIGLFENDADVVDEAMGHVREMRASSRMRVVP
jgi:hypothetical protein